MYASHRPASAYVCSRLKLYIFKAIIYLSSKIKMILIKSHFVYILLVFLAFKLLKPLKGFFRPLQSQNSTLANYKQQIVKFRKKKSFSIEIAKLFIGFYGIMASFLRQNKCYFYNFQMSQIPLILSKKNLYYTLFSVVFLQTI